MLKLKDTLSKSEKIENTLYIKSNQKYPTSELRVFEKVYSNKAKKSRICI